MKSNSNKKAYIFAISAILLWSTAATAFNITLSATDPISMLAFSSLASLLVIFTILLFSKKLYLLKLDTKKDLIYSVSSGLLNPFLYYIILFKAYDILKLANATQEALALNYTWPVMLVLLSIPILKQKISLMSIVSIIICFFGVLIISTHGNILSFRFSNPYGDSLALISSVIWASFWLVNMKDKRDSAVKLFYAFLFGAIFSWTAWIFSENQYSNLTNAIFGSIYIGLFEMGITFFLWLSALKYASSTDRISSLVFISPFLSLFWLSFIIDEKIIPSTIIGVIVIITGILIQKITQKN